ncbi:MAG: class I SAM-dependent methyltransferase [Nitrosopumilaceae archaeon]
MTIINPLDVILWTLRRNEKDVINLYDSLSPVMQVATGGSMLNFGYWTDKINEPILAQKNLCSFFGKFSELEDAQTVVDVGSGLSAPAIFWRNCYEKLNLYCVNINFKQLKFSGPEKNISFINSTSTKLPFADCSVDRVLALESSQHFKPIEGFILESKRILRKSGVLALAIPITLSPASIRDLGILKFTWSSEHYDMDFIRKLISENGFRIIEERLIGNQVYDPLSDYYSKNRESLKNSIQKQYPGFVEKILFKSIQRMKKASEEKLIDYLILKCKL